MIKSGNIWSCAYCDEKFDFEDGYNKEKDVVKCPHCQSDDINFFKDIYYIWGCEDCGEEFDYEDGYNKEKDVVICPHCQSDDTDFIREPFTM